MTPEQQRTFKMVMRAAGLSAQETAEEMTRFVEMMKQIQPDRPREFVIQEEP